MLRLWLLMNGRCAESLETCNIPTASSHRGYMSSHACKNYATGRMFRFLSKIAVITIDIVWATPTYAPLPPRSQILNPPLNYIQTDPSQTLGTVAWRPNKRKKATGSVTSTEPPRHGPAPCDPWDHRQAVRSHARLSRKAARAGQGLGGGLLNGG